MTYALNEIERIEHRSPASANDAPAAARSDQADIRCVVFAPEFPYPPNHGGRADCWRRIQAMRLQGHTIMLVCHYDDTPQGRPSADDIRIVKEHVQVLIACPLKKTRAERLRTLAGMIRLPMHVAARTPARRRLREICGQVRDFRPDLLWTEGPWGGQIALAAQRLCHCPIVYRSHNIEHEYRRDLARVAPDVRTRLRLWSTTVHLKRYQLALMKASQTVADISATDLYYWRQKGIPHAQWLPPLLDAEMRSRSLTLIPPAARGIDVLFLGNLNTPNNVEGVTWLVQEVIPRVLAMRPNTRFAIAGSQPAAQISRLCSGRPEVELIANAPSVAELYSRARILVNPVRHGSGVNIKSIDMLATNLPLVSTRQGTAGLPPQVVAEFFVDDDAAGFARKITQALDGESGDRSQREGTRRIFSPAMLNALIDRCLAPQVANASC